MDKIDDLVRKYSVGTAMTIHHQLGAHQPDARDTGTLKSVDWTKRTLILHRTIDSSDRTIAFDKITYIKSLDEQSADMYRNF